MAFEAIGARVVLLMPPAIAQSYWPANDAHGRDVDVRWPAPHMGSRL